MYQILDLTMLTCILLLIKFFRIIASTNERSWLSRNPIYKNNPATRIKVKYLIYHKVNVSIESDFELLDSIASPEEQDDDY